MTDPIDYSGIHRVSVMMSVIWLDKIAQLAMLFFQYFLMESVTEEPPTQMWLEPKCLFRQHNFHTHSYAYSCASQYAWKLLNHAPCIVFTGDMCRSSHWELQRIFYPIWVWILQCVKKCYSRYMSRKHIGSDFAPLNGANLCPKVSKILCQ